MPLSPQNGFSDKELNECKGWMLPNVSNGDETKSIEKKITNTQSLNEGTPESSESPTTDDADIIEVIEDVVIGEDDSVQEVLSAEKLQEITEAAEKEAYQIGFDKGFEKGEQDGISSGLNTGKQKIIDQSERLQHIIDALLAPLENEKEQLEALLLDMTCRLTETLLERELRTPAKEIATLVDSVLTFLPQSMPHFTLTLNPDDIAMVEQHLQAKSSRSSNKQSLHYIIEKDEKLLPGGCRLESSQTSIDASFETKLKTLLTDFIQKKISQKTEDKKSPEENATAKKQTSISEASEGDTQEDKPEAAPTDNKNGQST